MGCPHGLSLLSLGLNIRLNVYNLHSPTHLWWACSPNHLFYLFVQLAIGPNVQCENTVAELHQISIVLLLKKQKQNGFSYPIELSNVHPLIHHEFNKLKVMLNPQLYSFVSTFIFKFLESMGNLQN